MLKKSIQRILLKLAKSEKAKARARSIFVHFPNLKYMLVGFAYGSKQETKSVNLVYKDDFLDVIKLEVENRKRSIG